MQIDIPRKLFTVDEYHRMAEVGVLGPNDRVELIDGEIIQMTAMGSRHAASVMRATDTLTATFRGRAIVGPQLPLGLNDLSEPEPDLTLLRLRADFYASRIPTAGDALLVLEIADTTLPYDRGVKLPRYAAAGIPEVWLLDLTADTLEVFRDPSRSAFVYSRTFSRKDRVAPVSFPDEEIAVSGLLP